MKTGFSSSTILRRAIAAFSLIEIMVVMGLLSIIILGLLLMFNQTQRAFRAGMTQVDVLEGGRTVTEMLARELAQMSPAYRRRTDKVQNFYAELRIYSTTTPLLQPLPGAGNVMRTNLIEDLFFLKHENATWYGIGYFIRTSDAAGNLAFPDSVGTLYRFETNYTDVQFWQTPGVFNRDYNAARISEARASRVLDGVVHFKIKAYDTNGVWQTQDLPNNSNPVNGLSNLKSTIQEYPGVAPGEVGVYNYYSNAVPAFVEFELGMLEARIMERAKSIPDATARRNYLKDQASRVHLFRMRVPVRNVDPLAYQ